MNSTATELICGTAQTREVTYAGLPLSPHESLRLRNHSPDGYTWGSRGSGCAQLALAILLLCTDPDTALDYYQRFKEEWISRLPRDEDFCLALASVKEWLVLQQQWEHHDAERR